MLVKDEQRKGTAFLRYRTRDKSGNTSTPLAGTAFFVSVPAADESTSFVYLVTAFHVLEGIQANSVDGIVTVLMTGTGAARLPIDVDLSMWTISPKRRVRGHCRASLGA